MQLRAELVGVKAATLGGLLRAGFAVSDGFVVSTAAFAAAASAGSMTLGVREAMSVLLSVLLTLRTWARSRAALQLEILALRHQLQVLQRTRPRRLRLAKTDRWLWVVLSRLWTGWRTALVHRQA